MKNIKNNWLTVITLLVLVSVIVSCKKQFLDEYNPSNRTTDTYFNNAVGYESLVTSCYPLLRDITQKRFLNFPGTDVFSNSGYGGTFWAPSITSQGGPFLDTYDFNLNASYGELQTYWDLIYRQINRTNSVIARAAAVPDMSDSTKKIRVGEGKFLRAMSYFWAVQQWGDVPMPLEETTTGSLVVKMVVAKEVYTQIVKDLTEAVSVLPIKQKETGRATKGAAKFLLARVYLARGWNFNNSLGGSSADYTSALALCDDLIGSNLYPMESDWNNLFPLHNKNVIAETATFASSVAKCNASAEVIFAVQYANANGTNWNGDANTSLSGGVIGNNMHSQFGGGPSGFAQESRGTKYGRWIAQQAPTWAAYRLFDPQMDARYDGTFNNVTYATAVGSVSLAANKPYPQAKSISYKIGDTITIVTPWNKPITDPTLRGVNLPGGTKNYSVNNLNDNPVITISPILFVQDAMANGTPIFWKFFQAGTSYNDGFSSFNDPLFRSAELYLMAAEAITKGATGAVLGTADVYYNKVLDRALGSNKGKSPMRALNPENILEAETNVVSYRATPGNVTIDMILDEYAREFLGEGNQRWFDLKRTQTLLSRVPKYNGWGKWGIANVQQLAAKHYLRPLPQGMLDNSNPRINQNPGY